MPTAPAAQADAIEAQAVEKQAIGTQIVGTQIVETQARVTDGRQELALPQDIKTLLLLGIFSLLFFYALYLLGEVVVPIIVAFMLNMALQPPFQFMARHYVPKVVAAFLIVLL